MMTKVRPNNFSLILRTAVYRLNRMTTTRITQGYRDGDECHVAGRLRCTVLCTFSAHRCTDPGQPLNGFYFSPRTSVMS